MALLQFDCKKGGSKIDVVQSAGSSISGAVRLTVDSAAALFKLDALKAIRAVKMAIQQATWTSSGGATLRAAASTNHSSLAPAAYSVASSTTVDIIVRQAFCLGADIPAIILGQQNWGLASLAGVTNSGNAITIIAASIEIGAATQPVLFSGSRSVTIADGGNQLSDALAASAFSLTKFARGTTGFVRIQYRLNGAALKIPQVGAPRGTGSQSFKFDFTKVNLTTGIDQTGNFAYSMINGGVNGTDIVNVFSNMPAPMILGVHADPATGLWGDSKTYGTGDTATAWGTQGMSRALHADITLASTARSGINFGCPSGNALDCTTAVGGASLSQLTYWYQYVNHAVVGYGTNQVGASMTPFLALYAQIRANSTIVPIIQRSLTPRTTSTVSLSALTSVGTTCTGTMADTTSLINGQSYPIAGATPAAYNGTFAITVISGTQFTYTAGSAPGSDATGTLTIDDQWRSLQYQTTVAGWSPGGTYDTMESNMRGLLASDANLAYYQSYGERFATSGTNYWRWKVNGAIKSETADGLHESAQGYEDNINTGQLSTQAGGVIGTSLRTAVQAFA